MQARLNKMEAEMASLRSMQAAANEDSARDADTNGKEPGTNADADGMQTDDSQETVDSRSIYVGNAGLHSFSLSRISQRLPG